MPAVSGVSTTPSIQLFSRSSRLTVGTIQIANIGQQVGLDVWFSVKRTLKPNEPNTCDVKIYGLSDKSRKSIEDSSAFAPSVTNPPPTAPPSFAGQTANPAQTRLIPVKIEAGYNASMETLFLGEMRSAQTMRDEAEFVSELTSGDGDEAALIARVNIAVGSGANAYNVVVRILHDVMQIGFGNLQWKSVQNLLKASSIYRHGAVLKGNAHDIVQDIARGCGLEFRIIKGAAQFLPRGQALAGNAYRISASTGMIGNPSLDNQGVLSVETEMLPGLYPGSPIVMDSRFIPGAFRIVSMETVGSTFENDWKHRLECKRFNLAP